MFRRSKYDYSFRLRCVRKIVEQSCSITEMSTKTGVEHSNIRSWLRMYELNGKEGLRSRKRQTYSEQFKVQVVLAVQKERLSLNEACSRFDIRNECTINRWMQDYERQGVEGQAGEVCVRHWLPRFRAGDAVLAKVRRTGYKIDHWNGRPVRNPVGHRPARTAEQHSREGSQLALLARSKPKVLIQTV